MLKKVFLALATACLPHLIVTQEVQTLVQSKYPKAYAWYCDMAQKYPDAHLTQIKFCISDHHHAGTDAIFWPEANLKIINDSYQSSNLVSDANRQVMLEDEYLLLHEAYHVNHNHILKGNIAMTAAATASTVLTAGSIVQSCAQALPVLTATTNAVAGNVAIAAAVCAYARSQEQDADNFANQTADKSSLQAGMQWHLNNQQEIPLPANSSALTQTISEIYADPAHPAATSRLSSSQETFNDRFNLTLEEKSTIC